MRILASNATARVAQCAGARGAPASGGFSVDESEAPKSAQPAASLRTIGGIDALLALQGEDEPAERRSAPSSAAGSRSTPSTSSRSRCWAAPRPLDLGAAEVGDRRPPRRSGDDRLDSVLAEIELRLAVEIAKMSPAR